MDAEDRVGAAAEAVRRDRYMLHEDGTQVPQSSAPQVVLRMLRLLNVVAGATVLEVGTGSGYSTALLAHLTGPAGRVVSLDIDREMAERAARLLRGDGVRNVTVHCADGRGGYPAGAPYDRLIAWASSSQTVPEPWTQQVREGGLIVAPVRRGRRGAVIRLRVLPAGRVAEEDEIEAGFIPLTAAPLRPWER
jgi:protein-L-isoaspartate(D-aspartate) O-methyltransferase